MKKHFYSHLIEIETIHIKLETLDIAPEEKKHLKEILESTLNHKIVDTILSGLSEQDKKIFLSHLHNDKHELLWQHLKEKIENIEDKIKNVSRELVNEFHKDLEDELI